MKTNRTSVDELVAGLRLPVYELVWQTFRWIQGIWIKESKGDFKVFAEVETSQEKKRLDRFEYLMRGMFDEGEELLDELEPNSKHKIRFTVQYGPVVPKNGGYRELMSKRVAKKLAKRHAPWRLEDGR